MKPALLKKYHYSFLFLGLLLTGCLKTKPVPSELKLEKTELAQVKVTLDKASVRPGEEASLAWVLLYSKNTEVQVPPLGTVLQQHVRIVSSDRKEEQIGPALKRLTLSFKITGDLEGSAVIPGQEFGFKENDKTDVKKTSDIFIEIKNESASAAGTDKDIRDIRALEKIKWWQIPWVQILLGISMVALLATLGYWLVSRRRKQVKTERLLSAYEVFDQFLSNQTFTELVETDDLRRKCFELSEAVRIYLEKTRNISASDLTIEELRVSWKKSSEFQSEEYELVMKVLEPLEGIKFANEPVSTDVWNRYLIIAREILEKFASFEQKLQIKNERGSEQDVI